MIAVLLSTTATTYAVAALVIVLALGGLVIAGDILEAFQRGDRRKDRD